MSTRPTGWNWEIPVYVLATVMVIGVLISIAAILILAGTGSDDITTSRGGTSGNTTRTLEVVVSKVTPTSGSAPNPPARTTPQHFLASPLPASDGVNSSASAAAPSTIPEHFMICTVNGEGPPLEELTSPGILCDIIFFDSILKKVGEEVEATFNNSLQWFLSRPAHYKSQLGFSYSVETNVLLAKIVDGQLENQINAFYQYGVRHTAVINIHGESVTKEGLDVALYALKTAFKTVSGFDSEEAIYTVLGATINNASMVQVLLDQMKRVFVPSVFVSITHVSHEDRALKDCRIVPPTWLSVPNGEVSYGLSLTSSCQVLSEVAKAIVNITLAVSFTLSGHMYKPKGDKPEDYKLFNPCENFDGNYYVTPYEFVCKPNIDFFDKVQSDHSMFTFNTSAQRALTFESDVTIKNKVCEAKSTCQGVTFGVAAYDIEYDNQPHHPQCPEFGFLGPLGRVALLKNMNTYLTSLSSAAAFKKEECLRVEVTT